MYDKSKCIDKVLFCVEDLVTEEFDKMLNS